MHTPAYAPCLHMALAFPRCTNIYFFDGLLKLWKAEKSGNPNVETNYLNYTSRSKMILYLKRFHDLIPKIH